MTGNGKVNILLVDDQPAKLLSYEAILCELKENLIKAGSAKEALQHLLKTDVAVMLVDACMPEMDGFELSEMIRKHPRCKRTSIILVSAIYLSDFDRLRGYDCGAVDYVPVPIVPEVLRAKVSVFADLYRKTDDLQRLNAELEERVAQRTAELEASNASLRENEECLRSIVDTAVDAIIVIDDRGRIESLNAATERMFGYRLEEMRGRNVSMLMPPPYHDEHDRYLSNYLTTGVKKIIGIGREVLGRRKNGDIFPIELAVSEMLVHGRTRFTGIVRDVTERKNAEKERSRLLENEREARASAEQANRLKDEFLATLSHELRTPINAVLGWAQLIRRTQFDRETTEQGLEVIERGVRSQTQLIDDLLDVSRIISGKLTIEEDDVDLSAVVQAAIDAILPTARDKGLTLDAVIEKEGATLRGNAARLQQVFLNLLSNAIKFTPADGRVDVRLERIGDQLRVTVADSGQGIRADFLPHVFERFRQADSSITRRHGGLGLGLSIARHLVACHRGAIRAESDGEGRGARFVVTLPMASAPPAAVRALPAEKKPPESLGDVCALIVDDDPDTREIVARTLVDFGAQARIANSAYDALRLLRQWRPDILVCDIGMPGKDGYTLIGEVRAMAGLEKVPALALTAYTRAEDRARALEAGYNEHMAKPINPLELVLAVASLVNAEGAGRAPRPEAEPEFARPC